MEGFRMDYIAIIAITSFSTGLAVFLFDRLSSFLNRLLERKLKHYNSLVFYEGQLNNNLSRLYDILFVIPNIKNHLEKGNITWNDLRMVRFDGSRMPNIHSINLMNSLGLYEVNLYKLNDDVETMMSGYKEMKQALIEKNISHKEYVINCNELVKNLDLISKFTELTIENLLDALAEIRLRIKVDKPKTGRLIGKIIVNGMKEITDEEFKVERKKLLSEIDELSKKRKEEIERILL